MARKLNTGEEAFNSDVPVSERPMSNLEKVHFIVGYAIMRPGLRSVYSGFCSGHQAISLALSPWWHHLIICLEVPDLLLLSGLSL